MLPDPVNDPPLQVDAPPIKQKLLICSAPRTISTSLCRYLSAAGLAAPYEYFLPRISGSWNNGAGLESEEDLAQYIQMLYQRRSVDGLFACKIQFHQFKNKLTNAHGEALFRDAKLVHLVRSDYRGQLASHIAAGVHDNWHDVPSDLGRLVTREECVSRVHMTTRFLQLEDVSWRAFFTFSGQRPLIITDLMMIHDMPGVVRQIAKVLGRSVDEQGLAKFHAEHTGKYRAQSADKALIAQWIDEEFRDMAFSPYTYRGLRLPRRWRGRWHRFREKHLGAL